MDSPSTSSKDRWVPAGKTVRGVVDVPPSKSYTHRYFNLALLSGSSVLVGNPLIAEDTELFLAALQRCGFDVRRESGGLRLQPGKIPTQDIVELDCGNCGTMFRFLVATLATLPGRWRLDGTARLRERPVGPLVLALRRLGARIDCTEREGYAPLEIEGESLQGGRTELEAADSSQYLSALLMAALAAAERTTVEVRSLSSSPYVELTCEAIQSFGGSVSRPDTGVFEVGPAALRAERVQVEGDFSAACYPAAAAVLTGGEVQIKGLVPSSRQGDRQFFDLLQEMGAEVRWADAGVVVTGGRLQAVTADLGSMPDQVPTLAAVAAFARGVTRIVNVSHLRIKESDRLRSMAMEMRRVGVDVAEQPDGLEISGVWAETPPPSTEVRVGSHGDHRIAMSLALVGLRRPGVTVTDADVVTKSYPRFWQDLEGLLMG